VFELEFEAFDVGGSLQASIRQQDLGPVGLSRMSIGFGQVIRRTSASIGRSRTDQFELVYLKQGRVQLSQCGREIELEPGGCMLVDSREQYTLTTVADSCNLSFHIPVPWLRQWIPQPEAHVARAILPCTPWAEVLLASLRAVDLDPSLELDGRCAEQIAGALALSLGCDTGPRPPRTHQMKLCNRLRQTLIDLAHETGVDAARVARLHGISVRYLHALFATSGTTFARELMAIRLDRAARLLRDDRFARVSLADIAWRCAFFDASHLNRHFKAHFGVTPGAYRSAVVAPARLH
jgi:AraC-like DNA-binding protein